MCEVLHKDTIKPEILPHLSVSKHSCFSKGDQVKGIQYIFHKLKTGCQFHLTSAFP